ASRGASRGADVGHAAGGRSQLPRSHDGDPFDRRLQPVGFGRMGAGRRAGCRRRAIERLRVDGGVCGAGGGYSAWTSGALLVPAGVSSGMSARPLPIILALGTTQTLAWASSYYLPALLADPMSRALGVSSNCIFAAFSASLVISALLGPRIGRRIDLVGGR